MAAFFANCTFTTFAILANTVTRQSLEAIRQYIANGNCVESHSLEL